MDVATIEPGTQVRITDAGGREFVVLAVSGVESEGHSFPVVMVQRPLADGGTDVVPWPASAVTPV